MDVFGAWSKELLCQAVAANVSSVSPRDRDDAINKAVTRLLLPSGSGSFGQMAGNVLLAFSAQ
jgi:hypothetical protein